MHENHYLRTLLAAGALIALSACSPSTPDASKDAARSATVAEAPEAAAASPLPADVPAGVYTTDASHTSLIFRVDHLSFSNFTARFTRVDSKLQFDPANLAASSVQVTVDPASIQTDNAPDGFLAMLTNAEWLNAAQFPTITFRSTSVEPTAPNTMRITGDLSLHGVTKPIVLEARLNGGYAGHPMDPNARIGFSAHGTFKRSDFGVTIGLPPPGTNMGVGDDVNVVIETELSGPEWKHKDAQAAPAAH